MVVRAMTGSVFLDTAYAVALVVEQDQYHTKARALAAQIKEEELRLVTTRSVLIEIGNYLAKAHRRGAGIAFLEQVERDPAAEIVPVTEELFRAAFALYKERHDKAWGLTDCISFVVMRDRGITDALTTDRHFEQAGFKALLR